MRASYWLVVGVAACGADPDAVRAASEQRADAAAYGAAVPADPGWWPAGGW